MRRVMWVFVIYFFFSSRKPKSDVDGVKKKGIRVSLQQSKRIGGRKGERGKTGRTSDKATYNLITY